MASTAMNVEVRVPAVTRLRTRLARVAAACGVSVLPFIGRLRYDVRINGGRWRKTYSEVHVEVVDHGADH